MITEKLLAEKEAFIFELDDVLYPEKDYLLQVYYLFAQFIEYGEQISGNEIVAFMQQTYINDPSKASEIFQQTIAKFNIPEKYQVNFDLLLQNARLPLKLLLFNRMLLFLQEISSKNKQLFLFVSGDPAMQLNKIRQMEWNGLERNLVVYFAEESQPKPSPEGLNHILDKHNLKKEEVVFIGKTELDKKCAENAVIEFLNINKLLLI